MRKNLYVCPVCGRRAEFGKHFCAGGAVEAASAEAGAGPLWKIAVNSGIAALMVIVLLWGEIGAYSLAALAAPVGLVLWRAAGRSRRRGRAGEMDRTSRRSSRPTR